MGRIQCVHSYEDIISVENLLEAWQEFVRGKRGRKDVQEFQRDLMGNILSLHRDLVAKRYRHAPYEAFNISDPKPRSIHKANVRDRLLHRALYRKLYPFFDRTFIADSFSCRQGKGTHKALDRFRMFAYAASQNHTKTLWVLKCDVRKFFASIDHATLLDMLAKYIPDKNITALLSEIVGSFHTVMSHTVNTANVASTANQLDVGLPLGNLTSQLLVNIYMNRFDHFAKHRLRAKWYIRYADDFVIMSTDKVWLEKILFEIQHFLNVQLKLELHPDKVSINTLAAGVDFLGWVHFLDHRVLRSVTKRRMMKGVMQKQCKRETVQSYLGLLRHGNTQTLQREVEKSNRSSLNFYQK